MARWRDFLDEARSDLPGAPDFAIEKEIRRSAIEFFHESHAWRQRLDPIRLKTGRRDYDISAPGDIEVVTRVTYDDRPLDFVPIELFDEQASVESATPCKYTWDPSTAELSIDPVPDQAMLDEHGDLLRLSAILTPTQTSREIPDWLYQRYARFIVHGAKFFMMTVESKPWTNRLGAAFNESRFYQGIASAKRAAVRNHNRTTLTAQPNPWR